KTVTTLSGFAECFSAIPMAGRASPAAHPQTELTTIITVPFVLRITLSNSSGVRASSTPNCVKSSLMGLIRISGYGICSQCSTSKNFLYGQPVSDGQLNPVSGSTHPLFEPRRVMDFHGGRMRKQHLLVC